MASRNAEDRDPLNGRAPAEAGRSPSPAPPRPRVAAPRRERRRHPHALCGRPGAAGSVGSIVGQLAKADGLRVIGVAGGQEKCDWLVNDLGFDAAIDYKSDNLAEQLAVLTPGGIDVYFENTGGPIQALVYNRMNAHGRIAVCGHIADYQASTPAPGPNWMNIIKKRLLIQGFTMPDHFHEAPKLLEKLTPYVKQGKIKYRTHVLDGLESAMTGLNLFFTGGNKGKLIVKLNQ